MRSAQEIHADIMRLTEEYHQVAHAKKTFEPGKTKVPYAGRVYGAEDLRNGVDSMLQFWLTSGPYANKFEAALKQYFGAAAALTVNSGSSANLLMVATLCSKQVKNHLKPGDEVITPAVTFPTTLAPLIQHGLVPVFVDCKPGEYDIDATQLDAAVSERTRALFVPHTVGIPCDMDVVMDVARRRNLIVLEDGCDALGGEWDGKRVGTFGAMSSISFYPAHHITMGEGGMVIVNQMALKRTALSVRDWGRDCWCEPGVSNTCGMRFDWKLGELPRGYDHKYIYSNIGYNLKVTDMQAAIGCAQFEKLPGFIAARRENANFYLRELAAFQDHLVLPKVPAKANPSWFCFPITLKNHVSRAKFVQWLEDGMIETRLVFGGNILKQPGFMDIPRRVHGSLEGTDTIMNQTLFIGVYPGLTAEMRAYVVDRIGAFFRTQL